MAKYLLSQLAVILLISSAIAGEAVVVYQQQVDSLDRYSRCDPIIDPAGAYVGQICYDDDNYWISQHQITIHKLNSDSNIVVYVGRLPKRTVSYMRGDSLVIFALAYDLMKQPMMYKLIVMNDTVVVAETGLPQNWASSSLPSDIPQLSSSELYLVGGRSSPSAITYAQSVMHSNGNYIGPNIIETERLGSAAVVSLDLSLYSPLLRAQHLVTGNLLGVNGPAYAYVDIHVQGTISYWDGSWTGHSESRTVISDTSGATIFESPNSGLHVLVDDFFPWEERDEFIIQADGADLLGLHPDQLHIALYNISNGTTPREHWYQAMDYFELYHVYHHQHYVAGIRGDKMIALDYWSGNIADSADLGRALTDTEFFESGDLDPVLNLVGRVHDTIFVYQILTPTSAEDTQPMLLPSSFSLAQNYPNPFNNGTVVSFANRHRQQLTLSIYNVLGQEIVVLWDQMTDPGDHTVTWDGNDALGGSVASGVYFARLSSGEESVQIKLILLK